MEQLRSIISVVLLAACVPAVIKGVMLARGRRASNRAGTNRAGTNRAGTNRAGSAVPVRTAVVPRTKITETGPMVYYANDRHGQRDREYRFNYKKVGGSWRAYILRMPSLGMRDASGAVTHRLYDGGRPYVCWDRPVTSLKNMQTISKVWADSIQEYIATGRRFG